MGSSQRTQHGPAALLRSLLLTLLLSAAAAAAASVAKLPPFVEDVAGEIGGALTAAAWLQPPPPAAEGGGGGPELSRVVTGGTPGDFNLFIFAMSWKAEWCYHQNYPGCKKPRSFWENNLTIHGLWPDYGDGTYPTTCTSEPYDHDRVVGAVGLEVLETMWPNIQVPEGHANCHGKGKKYDSFWEHEWTKHGTCTGLSMEDYFITAVSLLQQRFVTPPQLAENVGGHVTRGELEDAYGGDGMAVLDCKGKVHLNQVYLCLEQDPETHLPGEQVACPPAIVAHDDTCGQDDLDVAAFE